MPHDLPPGVRRGPDGKFVASDSKRDRHYEDFEVITGDVHVTWGSGQVTSAGSETTFEGVEAVDFGELCARHDAMDLLWVEASLAILPQTATAADAWLYAGAELSASPSADGIESIKAHGHQEIDDQDQVSGDLTLSADDQGNFTDDPDILTRPLFAMAYASYDDGTDGAASGSGMNDSTDGVPAGEWTFDRRDELYVNGFAGIDGTSTDVGGHVTLRYQASFGVWEDC